MDLAQNGCRAAHAASHSGCIEPRLEPEDTNMRATPSSKRLIGLLVAAALPLTACDGGGTEDLGAGAEEEAFETAPTSEITSTQDVGLSTWDADADQQLSRDEWSGWYDEQGAYDGWNTDAEEGLTTDELGEGIFTAWDADADSELTETEWNEGVGTWYGDADYGTWGEWDADGDSILDANEVAEGLERENLYDTVDRDSDALIDDEELADWWFDIWDGNDDALIDTTEWDQVGSEWSRIGSGA
jgi:hypothetical protein